MWVAQITEPAALDQHHAQFEALKRRFPQYRFSIMMTSEPFIVCKPVVVQGNEGMEREILQFILTTLLDELMVLLGECR